MDIFIKNPPASGANFSENTYQSILKYAEFINRHADMVAPFGSFRESVSAETGTNIKNDRTIYPMLRYLGFINYKKGEDLCYRDFFTATGKALVKFISLRRELLILEKQTDKEKLQKINQAMIKAEDAISDLIFYGLKYLFKSFDDKEVSYRRYLIYSIRFMLLYKSINKAEYAFLIYSIDNGNVFSQEFEKKINLYRTGELEINYKVDAYDKKRGGNIRRKASAGNLTAYGYQMNLLKSAGIVIKPENEERFYLNEKNIDQIHDLLEQVRQDAR